MSIVEVLDGTSPIAWQVRSVEGRRYSVFTALLSHLDFVEFRQGFQLDRSFHFPSNANGVLFDGTLRGFLRFARERLGPVNLFLEEQAILGQWPVVPGMPGSWSAHEVLDSPTGTVIGVVFRGVDSFFPGQPHRLAVGGSRQRTVELAAMVQFDASSGLAVPYPLGTLATGGNSPVIAAATATPPDTPSIDWVLQNTTVMNPTMFATIGTWRPLLLPPNQWQVVGVSPSTLAWEETAFPLNGFTSVPLSELTVAVEPTSPGAMSFRLGPAGLPVSVSPGGSYTFSVANREVFLVDQLNRLQVMQSTTGCMGAVSYMRVG